MSAPSSMLALMIGVDDIDVLRREEFTDEFLMRVMQAQRLDVRSLPSGDTLVFNPDAPVLEMPKNEYATLLLMNSMLAGSYIAGTAFVFGERDKSGLPSGLARDTLTSLIMGWEKFTQKHFSHPDY